MTEKDLHLQINELLETQINANRIERLKEKQKPKTKIQRLRSIYLMILYFGNTSQVLGAILASTGVMYYLSTRLSQNGFFLAVAAAVVLIGLEISKHLVLKAYHSQRLDDKHVSKIMYGLICFLLLVNSFFAYYGTPHAIEYFTQKPALINLDSIAAKEDLLIAANIQTITKEIVKHDTTAQSIYSSAAWKNKLGNKDRPAYQAALTAKAQAESKLTAITLQGAKDKAQAIKDAENENKARLDNYLDWCLSFGTWLALVSLALDVIFFFAFWYCENYTRLEVKEFEAIEKLKESLETSTQRNDTPLTPKKVAKGRVRNTVNTTPLTTSTPQRSMQIITGQKVDNTPQEGDIVKEEGKRDRVLVDIKGQGLVPKTLGELNTLIKAQTTETRIEHLENLAKKLKP